MTDANKPGFPPRLYLITPEPENPGWFEGAESLKEITKIYHKDAIRYLSLDEHEHLLAEAVREARMQAFDEAIDIVKKRENPGLTAVNILFRKNEERERE